ncbi:MAG: sugar ABC transporter ATP-binding protein [Clostridium sp.]
MEEVILKITDLSKKYEDNLVLNNINLDIKKGSIHGIVGANGSGKSTLFNILCGNEVIKQTGGYQGDIYIKGKKVNINTVGDSKNLGIGIIYQELALFSDMRVFENIMLNCEKIKKPLDRILPREISYIDKKENKTITKSLLKNLNIGANEGDLVENISLNTRQFLEIAREVNRESLEILLLDEPTAALSHEDSSKLMEILKLMASRGITIIFVSHRLEEITGLCDRVTVMRDGSIISSYEKEDFSLENIALNMIGHRVSKISRSRTSINTKTLIEFNNFNVLGKGEKIKEFNLSVNKGEIIGLAGLSGHGKLALAQGVYGLKPTTGEIKIENNILKSNSIEMIKNSIGYISEDRREIGLLVNKSIKDNIGFSLINKGSEFLKYKILRGLSPINRAKVRDYSKKTIDKYRIKCQSENQLISMLSGGNQQKVSIGKTLALKPKVLFVSEPTRGVDIGAKEIILETLVELNEESNTTMFIASSEIEELKRVCDRIIVFYENRVFKIMDPLASDIEFASAFSGIEVNKNEDEGK